MKKIINIFAVLVILSLSFITIETKKKLKTVKNELEMLQKDNSELSGSINEQIYYQNQLINQENYHSFVDSMDQYILYFHQDACTGCANTDKVIHTFVVSGYGNRQGEYPVLFVEYHKYKELFDSFSIKDTPSIVYVKNNKKETYTGVADVTAFMQQLVNE